MFSSNPVVVPLLLYIIVNTLALNEFNHWITISHWPNALWCTIVFEQVKWYLILGEAPFFHKHNDKNEEEKEKIIICFIYWLKLNKAA